MSAKRKTPPRRDPDQTTLTISLPKGLKEAVEKAAKADNRSTSNFAATSLAKLLRDAGFLVVPLALLFPTETKAALTTLTTLIAWIS